MTCYKNYRSCLLVSILFGLLKRGDTKYMKAVIFNRYGPPDVLHVEEVPVPTISYHEILVRVRAAGINPIDAYIRDGSYHTKPPLPTILGKEISGFVEEVGAAVTTFQKNDRVFCGIENGGYAEYAAANASHCFPLPESMSFNQGAALHTLYFAAYKALIRKAQLKVGETVLIHGANGGIGTAAIQIAKIVGAYVVATVGEYPFEELMKKAGADHVAYHDHEGYLTQALEKINKTGFDVILEVFTNANVSVNKQFLTPEGRIIAMGDRFRAPAFDKELKNANCRIFSVSFTKCTDRQEQMAAHFILNSARCGWIVPIVARKYQLEECVRAHKHISYTKSSKGKLVFRM